MATAKNTRARRARSAPRRAKRPLVLPDSPAGILSAVSRRLKFVMAAAFTIDAALRFQNAELDEDIALMVGRCVGDEVDRQIEAIDHVIARLAGARETSPTIAGRAKLPAAQAQPPVCGLGMRGSRLSP